MKSQKQTQIQVIKGNVCKSLRNSFHKQKKSQKNMQIQNYSKK